MDWILEDSGDSNVDNGWGVDEALYTTALPTNLTEEQFAQLEALTHKWNTTCKGDYESTFVGGVAHGYCDSGILTDGLSARDIDTLQKYFTGETIYSIVGIHTLQQWVQEIAQDDEFVLLSSIPSAVCMAGGID
mgnify:CR=1 FL=1